MVRPCSEKWGHWGLTVNSLTTPQQPRSVFSLALSISSCMWCFCFSHSSAFTFLLPSQPSEILTVCCTSLFFPGENVGHCSDSRKAATSRSSAAPLFFHRTLLAYSSWRHVCVCCCLVLTQSARVEGQTTAYSSPGCTGYTKSWSVSALQKREILYIPLHIIKDKGAPINWPIFILNSLIVGLH